MPQSQVTVTLGPYGQKVVKESWGDSAGGRDSGPWLSGSKRSVSESFGSSAADYMYGGSKRMRGETSSRSYASSSRSDAADSGLCPNDLRLKLQRKRASRVEEVDGNGYRRNVQRFENVSGQFRSREFPGDNILRTESSSMRITGPPRERSMASSFSSWPSSSGVRARSPEITTKHAARIPNLRRTSNELSRLPMARPDDASRTGRMPLNQPADSYRPKVPRPSVPRIDMEPERLVREHSSAASGMFKPPPVDNQPVTIGWFLSSLGLEKYSINFQAEEIDMAALKQMRDSDLKELGIPMGPRKKILLTLQGPGRRPVQPLPNNQIH